MQSITIDCAKRLKEELQFGHNRWHPYVPPIVAADPGEETVFEVCDVSDSQIQQA